MNNHFHPRHLDSEKPVRLDHLQALVEERGRIDRDLRPHVPGRMLQRPLRCDGREFPMRRLPKRPARRGQDDAAQIVRECGRGLGAPMTSDVATDRGAKAPPTLETLKDRVVLRIDRQDLRAFPRRGPHHCLARHDEDLLARHRQVFPRLDRRQCRPQAPCPDNRNQHHVGIRQAGDLLAAPLRRPKSPVRSPAPRAAPQAASHPPGRPPPASRDWPARRASVRSSSRPAR